MEDLKKVLISDPLSNKGIEILGRAKGLKVEIHTGLSAEELKKIIPEYDAIVIRSETKLKAKPGGIGQVGMVLGNQNINIATLHLGRDRFGGNAISLVHLDAPLPPGTVGEILRIPNIISVRQISL